MRAFFITFFYQPLYNGLIALINILPFADVGIAVILFTCVVKLVLFPLSRKAIVTQLRIKEFEPELNKLKKKYEKDKQEQARKMMEFYKEKGINPFSSILQILIQMPIVISLYYIFLRAGLPEINQDLLYSFVAVPQEVNMLFLGLVDISERSVILALLVGISSFFQIRFSMPKLKPRGKEDSFKEDFARSMNVQMRYVFPVLLFFIALSFSGAVALYLLTSSLFTIGQELYVRKRIQPSSVEDVKTEEEKN